MAKAKSVKLTFAVTLEQPKGVTLQEMRAYILESLQANKRKYDFGDADLTNIKCHLTNKEVTYG